LNGHRLLLISRRDLLAAGDGPEGDTVIRALSELTREGFHFVATASQPDEWSRNSAVSKRSKPGPKRIRDRLAEAGGVLDGVYYIPQSLLTQQTRREEALTDLLQRFTTSPRHCYLASSNRKLVSAGNKLKINTRKISNKQSLEKILKELSRTS
jgi:hypothetical protein